MITTIITTVVVALAVLSALVVWASCMVASRADEAAEWVPVRVEEREQ